MKNKKLLFPILLLTHLFVSIEAYAVSAYPYKVIVDTENGKTAEIYMRGDEYQKFAVTPDGYTLLNDSNGWWYATHSEEGFAVKSEFKLMSVDDETEELKKFKSTCPKGIVPQRTDFFAINKTLGQRKAKVVGPVVGERKALVVLMQFRDLSFKKTREDFVDLFNKLDYHENNVTGSVRDYYRWASQGQLDYVSDVFGPYTSQNSMSYYGNEDEQTVELCVEAVLNLPDSVDFSQYDNDGDGLVDNIHIIFAGYGEEAGASADAIWSHEYPRRIALKKQVGYSFAGYSCTPELRGNRGSRMSHIGVVCHELGHALGAMDYYDTNYDTGGEFVGTGQWDIMANGSWNDDGQSPANFNPYVRCTIFGWNTQEVLENNQQIVMPRMEIDNAEQSIVYRINTGSEGDYFLLENRQQYKFDVSLPGAGLMIYHVHPNLERYRLTNTINATHPQGFYPVCASYSEPNRKNYGEINSGGCPFPGNNRIRSFSPYSSPAAVAWNGSQAKVSITNISMDSSSGSILFTTGETSVIPEEPDKPMEKEVIYKESFETSTNNSFTILSVMGKNLWRTYKMGNWVIDGDRIPEAMDGERILMLYSPKDNATSESEIIGPYINIEPVQEYILTFDVYTEGMSGIAAPALSLYVEDERESRVYTLDKITDQWIHVELPLRFGGDQFRYKFNGSINSGGIFIDNVCLYQDVDTSTALLKAPKSINCRNKDGQLIVEGNFECVLKLSGINGRKIYKSQMKPNMPVAISNVSPGIYIITTDDGLARKICVR